MADKTKTPPKVDLTKVNLTEIDIPAVDSPALRRLIEEVRREEPNAPGAYNRVYNRHNR